MTSSAHTGAFIVDPTWVQAVPFHRATIPGDELSPPANRSPPGMEAKARTWKNPGPPPNVDQADPFHRAMLCALTPPADVKAPPIAMVPSASLRSDITKPLGLVIPSPRGAHAAPSHWAIRL